MVCVHRYAGHSGLSPLTRSQQNHSNHRQSATHYHSLALSRSVTVAASHHSMMSYLNLWVNFLDINRHTHTLTRTVRIVCDSLGECGAGMLYELSNGVRLFSRYKWFIVFQLSSDKAFASIRNIHYSAHTATHSSSSKPNNLFHFSAVAILPQSVGISISFNRIRST